MSDVRVVAMVYILLAVSYASTERKKPSVAKSEGEKSRPSTYGTYEMFSVPNVKAEDEADGTKKKKNRFQDLVGDALRAVRSKVTSSEKSGVEPPPLKVTETNVKDLEFTESGVKIILQFLKHAPANDDPSASDWDFVVQVGKSDLSSCAGALKIPWINLMNKLAFNLPQSDAQVERWSDVTRASCDLIRYQNDRFAFNQICSNIVNFNHMALIKEAIKGSNVAIATRFPRNARKIDTLFATAGPYLQGCLMGCRYAVAITSHNLQGFDYNAMRANVYKLFSKSITSNRVWGNCWKTNDANIWVLFRRYTQDDVKCQNRHIQRCKMIRDIRKYLVVGPTSDSDFIGDGEWKCCLDASGQPAGWAALLQQATEKITNYSDNDLLELGKIRAAFSRYAVYDTCMSYDNVRRDPVTKEMKLCGANWENFDWDEREFCKFETRGVLVKDKPLNPKYVQYATINRGDLRHTATCNRYKCSFTIKNRATNINSIAQSADLRHPAMMKAKDIVQSAMRKEMPLE